MLTLAMLLQAVPVPAGPPPAPWSVQTRTKPDGSVAAAFAAARSRDGAARLVVRCDRSGDPVVSLQFRLAAHPLAAGEDHAVAVAVDGAKPIAAAWQFPGVAMVMSEPETVTELTVALEAARAVTISTTDGGAPVVATFDGPAGAPGGSGIRAVLNACGYTFGTVPEPIKPQPK